MPGTANSSTAGRSARPPAAGSARAPSGTAARATTSRASTSKIGLASSTRMHPRGRVDARTAAARATSAARRCASTSPPVSTTPRSARTAGRRAGCRTGVCSICWRRSGEALSRNQCAPSALTASDAWVRGARRRVAAAGAAAGRGVGVPLRESRHRPRRPSTMARIGHLSALVKVSLERMAALQTRSDRPPDGSCRSLLLEVGAGVGVDLGTERDFDDLGGLPGHSALLHFYVTDERLGVGIGRSQPSPTSQRLVRTSPADHQIRQSAPRVSGCAYSWCRPPERLAPAPPASSCRTSVLGIGEVLHEPEQLDIAIEAIARVDFGLNTAR